MLIMRVRKSNEYVSLVMKKASEICLYISNLQTLAIVLPIIKTFMVLIIIVQSRTKFWFFIAI